MRIFRISFRTFGKERKFSIKYVLKIHVVLEVVKDGGRVEDLFDIIFEEYFFVLELVKIIVICVWI